MNVLLIEDRYYNFILKVLNQNLPQSKFYLFGSRAKKINSEYSDIDIALDDNKKEVDISIINKLNSLFENSTFPYEIDIIDLNNVGENFKSKIKTDLVELI